jgi:hypothetical protein
VGAVGESSSPQETIKMEAQSNTTIHVTAFIAMTLCFPYGGWPAQARPFLRVHEKGTRKSDTNHTKGAITGRENAGGSRSHRSLSRE